MGPAKSNCISSLGPISCGRVPSLSLDVNSFRFLPWSRHCLQFSALSLCNGSVRTS